ncbi:aspartyl-phosphate phosphatase Spo0E family protein [Paenibacillus amylolyticus]|uniref:Aspartyl-phosphate phosphatase Spo0E family protein n=1 Tax=Paenibacillus amylolyticus TaxID=1451 RepID=A0ABD8B395_PAEAM
MEEENSLFYNFEELRQKMHELSFSYALTSPQMIEISMELDLLHNQINAAKKADCSSNRPGREIADPTPLHYTTHKGEF